MYGLRVWSFLRDRRSIFLSRYTRTNKGSIDLLETTIGLYADPDIGNPSDDYVLCDVSRDLGIGYNGDMLDGTGPGKHPGIPPAAALDVLSGPLADVGDGVDNDHDGELDEVGERIGMSRFLDFQNSGLPFESEPFGAPEYYPYLNGIWRDGTQVQYGGHGHPNGGSNGVNALYMYPADSDPLGYGKDMTLQFEWSEETASNPIGDKRFLLCVGDFELLAGETESLHVGTLWAEDQSGSGVESTIDAVQTTSDSAQAAFNASFSLCSSSSEWINDLFRASR